MQAGRSPRLTAQASDRSTSPRPSPSRAQTALRRALCHRSTALRSRSTPDLPTKFSYVGSRSTGRALRPWDRAKLRRWHHRNKLRGAEFRPCNWQRYPASTNLRLELHHRQYALIAQRGVRPLLGRPPVAARVAVNHSSRQKRLWRGQTRRRHRKVPPSRSCSRRAGSLLPLGLGGGVSGDIRGPPGPFSFQMAPQKKKSPKQITHLGFEFVAS